MMTNDESTVLEVTKAHIKNQRKRCVFDVEQIRHLEHVFGEVTHYPDLLLRQRLTVITQLPDKKIQIWFQNRRAKWRKQHQLGHFGGLQELTVDGCLSFVPAPKANLVLPTAIPTMSNNFPNQQLQQLFYLTFQNMLSKPNDYLEQAFLMKGQRVFDSNMAKRKTQEEYLRLICGNDGRFCKRTLEKLFFER